MIDYNLTIFETSKQVSVTRGTTQIAPASLPIPLFRLQQALCRNAARTERFYLPEKIRRSSFRLRSYKYLLCFPGFHQPPGLSKSALPVSSPSSPFKF
jgi:hypothetical protein